jgi:hypothetical protein
MVNAAKALALALKSPLAKANGNANTQDNLSLLTFNQSRPLATNCRWL